MHHPRNPGASPSARWVTSRVLQALATIAPRDGDQFTGAQLLLALPNEAAPRVVRSRTKLVALGFARCRRTIVDGQPLYTYTTTPEGAAAIAAAAQGAMLLCGNRASRPAKPGTLRERLWKLLRIRQVLDADEAATLLCDAGGNHTGMRAQCSDLLRLWAAAGHLQVSAKVGKQRRKRYVLPSGAPASAPPRSAAVPSPEGAA